MSSMDDLEDRVNRLVAKIDGLVARLGFLERAFEETLDLKPLVGKHVIIEVNDTNKVAAAITLGTQLSEARKSARAAKESATNLRKVLAPNDDTGRHEIDKDK